jgi:HEAT repeat protein
VKSDILGSVADDPAMERGQSRRTKPELRRRQAIAAGHRGDEAAARRALADPDPSVQAAALGALARCGALGTADISRALAGGPVQARRRAADLARAVRGAGSRSTLVRALIDALADEDPLVVVQAAWFCGERRAVTAVPALVPVAVGHDDQRCREAAVAALGAIGDPAGLPAVLGALEDKPSVRRRATVALAGFDDPRVDEALARSAQDRDWQVRQAADELLED